MRDCAMNSAAHGPVVPVRGTPCHLYIAMRPPFGHSARSSSPVKDKKREKSALVVRHGHGSKPMVPILGRCTTHVSLF